MKKIMFFAAIAALTMASCGNKTAQSDELGDTVAVNLQVPAVADSLKKVIAEQIKEKEADMIQVSLAKIQMKYAELVKEGKLEDAKVYAEALQSYVKENAEAIKAATGGNAIVSQLISDINNLPTADGTTMEQALSAVNADAQTIAEQAAAAAGISAEDVANAAVETGKAAADAQVQAAKAKVEEKKAEAKAQVNAKVEEAKTKAAEATNKAINDAASKLLQR